MGDLLFVWIGLLMGEYYVLLSQLQLHTTL